MKNFQITILALSVFSFAQVARSQSLVVEIGVERVFVPAQGFDDNDTVEVVIDGQLPNTCYALEKNRVDYNAKDQSFTIKQYAVKQTEGFCAETNSDDPRLNTLVPYTDTITLGKVSEGTYSVKYFPNALDSQAKEFSVVEAPVTTVDTLPYAMVTSVGISDIIQTGSRIYADLSGMLNNSCYSLNDAVEVRQSGDVLIILPTVSVDTSGPCLMYVRPFNKQIDLGVLPANRYLIHVRSMNGKSVNRVFSVMEIQKTNAISSSSSK